jgi:hypothetical protein
MKPTLLVLAAGMGSRYGGLKQMDPLGPNGESIIDYSVYDAAQAGFGKVIFVLREEIVDDFFLLFANKYKSKIEVDYVIQRLDDIPEGIALNPERKKPWGTGHAMLSAREKLTEPFAVINGDDFYGSDAFKVMSGFLSTVDPNDISMQSMVGYILSNTLSEYGHVSRGICSTNSQQCLTTVTERTKIQREAEQIVFYDDDDTVQSLTGDEIVSMNFWGFTPALVGPFYEKFVEFMNHMSTELKSEYFIPLGINQLIQDKRLDVKVLESSARWFGVTYQEDKPLVISKLRELSATGVYPDNLWI